ncbi:hypothetical protein CRYUN_Cryun11dG0067000 [Craigia yunnanensis]
MAALRQLRQIAQEVSQPNVTGWGRRLAALRALSQRLSRQIYFRGSLGFGEEALQSLPGKVGSQDVNDVLTAIDHVIEKGLANPSKITVLGGSHGGFLTMHLIGQMELSLEAPDKFVAAAARNPVCNISSMVGITDIPDWCFAVAYGSNGKMVPIELISMTCFGTGAGLALYEAKSIRYHNRTMKAFLILVCGSRSIANEQVHESKKRVFGTDVTNISFKRNKVHSSNDLNFNQCTKMQKQIKVENLVAVADRNSSEDSKQGSKSYQFGPFAPVNLTKFGNSENNVKRVHDWESLASTYRPQYHNQDTFLDQMTR